MRTVPLRGLWLVAKTPLQAPYPCRCAPLTTGGTCHPVYCPCAGRIDLDHVPAGCCGHRVRPHHVAAATLETSLQRAAAARRRDAARAKRNAPRDG